EQLILPRHHPRYLRRRRRPSSSAAPLIASGEAFASTGAERTWVLEHRSAAPLPRGLGEAKTRDRRASWSVKIPAMPPPPRPSSSSSAPATGRTKRRAGRTGSKALEGAAAFSGQAT